VPNFLTIIQMFNYIRLSHWLRGYQPIAVTSSKAAASLRISSLLLESWCTVHILWWTSVGFCGMVNYLTGRRRWVAVTRQRAM